MPATTPAWRIPPPRRFLARLAKRITSVDPTKTLPNGAPSPLDKQIATLISVLAHGGRGYTARNNRIEDARSINV
jgi:hypothetical protein